MRDQFNFADRLDVADKTVLAIDVNVPIVNGLVSNDTGRHVMPEVRALLDNGAKVVILTHFVTTRTDCSLFERAASSKDNKQNFDQPVPVESDVIGKGGRATVDALHPGILLMENLRFYKGEENDQSLQGLAALVTFMLNLFLCTSGSCLYRCSAKDDAICSWTFVHC